MSILDALPGIALGAFGSMFRNTVLEQAAPGAPDGRGGTLAGAITQYPCKGLVENYSDVRKALAAIPETDRKITVLAATLPSNVVPHAGDIVGVDLGGGQSGLYTVIGVSRDPAGATYEIQGR